jgi:hypothetical protein
MHFQERDAPGLIPNAFSGARCAWLDFKPIFRGAMRQD